MFDATFNDSEKILTCKFSGKMDTITSKEIEEQLGKKMVEINVEKSDLRVVFDMKDVEYIASSFMRICLATAKEVGEGSFSVINTKPIIKKTFKVAGLDGPLHVS